MPGADVLHEIAAGLGIQEHMAPEVLCDMLFKVLQTVGQSSADTPELKLSL